MSKRALIIVDVQNDFCKGGSLEVPKGDEVVAVMNELRKREWDLIVLSQDFHPKNHLSFANNNEGAKLFEMKKVGGIDQVMWPDHCVQGTKGAAFHPELVVDKDDVIIQKGVFTEVDSYSAFLENDKKSKTKLDEILKTCGITDIFVGGLAYDYCVRFTIVDGKNLGYNVHFVEDAARGIDQKGCEKAKEEMIKIGVHVTKSSDVK